MAFDQLSLYNEALRIVGERPLASLAETREPRLQLDAVWAFGAVNFCLTEVKPRFAVTTVKLTSFTTDANLGYANVFALPTGYLEQVGVYSNAGLDEPVTRYIVQGASLATDHTEIYVRYVSNVAPITVWTESFARVVAAYLAREIVPRIKPTDIERVVAEYDRALAGSQKADSWEEPGQRSQIKATTLTASWLQIYNDACTCMGLPRLISVNDDSQRRVEIDSALNQGAVVGLVEKYQWSWANTSRQIDYDPDVETEWGYRYGFQKPTDMERLAGVFTDEGLYHPLKQYSDEGDYLFTDLTTIYLQYVSNSMLNNPALWPQYFREMVAAYLATRVAVAAGGSAELAAHWWTTRELDAKNTDAMVSPPRVLANGSWVSARNSGRSSYGRGRP